ncbi:MAG: hypothetical protein AAGE98_15630 [Actinomycetota bacterium]
MAYDPQANRRRPKPTDRDPAPVDALLGDAPAPAPAATPTVEDPPPAPGVTPAPADPVPDSWVLSTGMGAALGAIIGLFTLRWLWKRSRRPVDAG